MGRVTVILCLIFSVSFAKAQNDSVLHVSLEKLIAGNYTNFYTDNLADLYLLSKTNQVKKLDQHYDSTSVFNDVRRYGDIYLLDVNNPLKILLYYKDFTTILVLDRFLNTRNTIDLRKYGMLQAKAVAVSYDNKYWIFDELDNTIKKMDDNGNILLQFADFRILFADAFNPSRIIDSDGLLYLYDEKKGCLVFDYYGSLKQRINWMNKKDVQVSGKNLWGRDSTHLYSLNIQTFTENKFEINVDFSGAAKTQVSGNKLFVLDRKGLSVYRIE